MFFTELPLPLIRGEAHPGSLSHIFNLRRHCPADLLEARKIPPVREVAALLGLHRLYNAVASFEEYTLTVWLVLERQSAPIFTEPRVTLNEVELAHAEKSGHSGDLFIAQPHLPRPATALGATNTFVMNRHEQELNRSAKANQ